MKTKIPVNYQRIKYIYIQQHIKEIVSSKQIFKNSSSEV